jgi:imidazolonepropionase-like amidohydrolase
MRKVAKALAVLAGVLLPVVLGIAQGGGPEPVLLIVNANIIDGVSAQPVRGAAIQVRGAQIEKIIPGKVEAPAGATVLDLQGRWVLPGFVDGHVHLNDLPSARRALLSGATTVRSMGVAHFVDAGMRDLHRAGAADLPDVLAAGYHVRPRVDENLFVSFPELRDLAGGVSGVENVRRVVRAMAGRGVNHIKILATERAGLPETDPRKRTFTDEELAAAVDEARKAGLGMAAHAHGDEGAAAAVRAGVTAIEHGTYLSESTLALMKQRGTCLDPTIATVADLIEPGGDYDNAGLSIRGRHMLPRVREATARAWKMGVKIIAGTDTGYSAASNRRMPHEVAEFVALGMPPMDAIKAATSLAAECAGVGARTGAIQPGLEADLVVVERDPLADIIALQDVLIVVNNGKVALNRLAR